MKYILKNKKDFKANYAVTLMSFGEINLLRRIGKAQTLAGALSRLKGLEFIAKNMDDGYEVLAARREFVVLENIGDEKTQYLHPYRARMVYAFRKPLK
jgi:hypothetical protein